MGLDSTPLRERRIGRVVIGQKYFGGSPVCSACSPTVTFCSKAFPGLAKTLTVKTLAACIQTGFQRLQFTPDLLPADLIEAPSFTTRAPAGFTTKLGPLFFQQFLARQKSDRCAGQGSSALLEAMQERQV